MIEDEKPKGWAGWLKFAGEYLIRFAILLGASSGVYTVSQIGCNGRVLAPPTTPATSPGTPATPPPTKPTNAPEDAICRIQFGNAGCSATLIWPPRPDGRMQLLTAAHCLDGQPKEGVGILRDGRRFRVVNQFHVAPSDVGWLITELPVVDFPSAVLAKSNPKVGDKVWHAGYGTDKPGNREEGVVVADANFRFQIEYDLSVSHGDSGGGIALNSNGEVLSPVCCSTAPGRRARVWGASPEECRKLRPDGTFLSDLWTPLPLPVVKPD